MIFGKRTIFAKSFNFILRRRSLRFHAQQQLGVTPTADGAEEMASLGNGTFGWVLSLRPVRAAMNRHTSPRRFHDVGWE